MVMLRRGSTTERTTRTDDPGVTFPPSLHRTRACASLYTYCIYELRFSEDAAARRAGAAKLVKRFPLLLGAIAKGELHLTGLLMLGPHLTPENLGEVLGRAKFRTKKELGKLVRERIRCRSFPTSWSRCVRCRRRFGVRLGNNSFPHSRQGCANCGPASGPAIGQMMRTTRTISAT